MLAPKNSYLETHLMFLQELHQSHVFIEASFCLVLANAILPIQSTVQRRSSYLCPFPCFPIFLYQLFLPGHTEYLLPASPQEASQSLLGLPLMHPHPPRHPSAHAASPCCPCCQFLLPTHFPKSSATVLSTCFAQKSKSPCLPSKASSKSVSIIQVAKYQTQCSQATGLLLSLPILLTLVFPSLSHKLICIQL